MDVDEMLEGADPKPRVMSQALQGTVKRELPKVVGRVKWGSLVYAVNGKSIARITH